MDKDHVVKLMAKGILDEMTQEAMDTLQELSKRDKVTLSDVELKLMELGANMGAAMAVNWLHRNEFLKDEVTP